MFSDIFENISYFLLIFASHKFTKTRLTDHLTILSHSFSPNYGKNWLTFYLEPIEWTVLLHGVKFACINTYVLASRCGYKLMFQNLLIFILYFNGIMGKRKIFFHPLDFRLKRIVGRTTLEALKKV